MSLKENISNFYEFLVRVGVKPVSWFKHVINERESYKSDYHGL